jgi:hypothetical protein
MRNHAVVLTVTASLLGAAPVPAGAALRPIARVPSVGQFGTTPDLFSAIVNGFSPGNTPPGQPYYARLAGGPVDDRTFDLSFLGFSSEPLQVSMDPRPDAPYRWVYSLCSGTGASVTCALRSQELGGQTLYDPVTDSAVRARDRLPAPTAARRRLQNPGGGALGAAALRAAIGAALQPLPGGPRGTGAAGPLGIALRAPCRRVRLALEGAIRIKDGAAPAPPGRRDTDARIAAGCTRTRDRPVLAGPAADLRDPALVGSKHVVPLRPDAMPPPRARTTSPRSRQPPVPVRAERGAASAAHRTLLVPGLRAGRRCATVQREPGSALTSYMRPAVIVSSPSSAHTACPPCLPRSLSLTCRGRGLRDGVVTVRCGWPGVRDARQPSELGDLFSAGWRRYCKDAGDRRPWHRGRVGSSLAAGRLLNAGDDDAPQGPVSPDGHQRLGDGSVALGAGIARGLGASAAGAVDELAFGYPVDKDASGPGADGGISTHIIEQQGGETISVTHQVTRGGEVAHQHQTHIGQVRRQPPVPGQLD